MQQTKPEQGLLTAIRGPEAPVGRLATLTSGTVNLTRHAPDSPEIDFVFS